jgi:hypothetical protein
VIRREHGPNSFSQAATMVAAVVREEAGIDM